MRKIAEGVLKRGTLLIPDERRPQKDLGQHFSDSVFTKVHVRYYLDSLTKTNRANQNCSGICVCMHVCVSRSKFPPTSCSVFPSFCKSLT